MKRLTKNEIRNKLVAECKRIYSRKYRRAHYRNRWELASNDHTAEEDFKNWSAEYKIILRKHKAGILSDVEMVEQIDKWNNEDVEIKRKIDENTLIKKEVDLQ